MTREEVIECMTDGAVNRPFGVASTIRDRKRLDMVAALAALEARGIVIVNARPNDDEIKKISEGMGWTGSEPTIRKWVECLIREMNFTAP
jgi:hypothetical protein